jgi:hypothetical protein
MLQLLYFLVVISVKNGPKNLKIIFLKTSVSLRPGVGDWRAELGLVIFVYT